MKKSNRNKVQQPPGKVRVQFSLPAQEAERLDAIARKLGIRRDQLVETFVRQGMEKDRVRVWTVEKRKVIRDLLKLLSQQTNTANNTGAS